MRFIINPKLICSKCKTEEPKLVQKGRVYVSGCCKAEVVTKGVSNG